MTYKMSYNLVQNNNLYSRSCSKDFNTTQAPLNTSPNTVRVITFTKFMVRGLDTTYFPFYISKDVIGC